MGILIPAAISLAGIVVAMVSLPAVSEIAVHWSPDGTADGYAAPWTVVVGMALVALLGALAFGLVLLASTSDGPTVVRRFLAVVALGFAVFMSGLGCWILLSQGHGETAPIWQGLLLAAVAGVVVALLGALVAPPVVSVDPQGLRAGPLPLAPGERAVWIGRTRMATPGLVAIAAVVVVTLAAAVLANVATAGALGQVFLVPAVLLVVLLLTSFWTVRVDDDGLEVRSAIGWPRFRMPAAQVASAGTVDLRALGEFGGWGIRLGRGARLGIVMRSGPALEAQNRDGRALVVTVDDAGTAAALLSAVAERATAAGGRG